MSSLTNAMRILSLLSRERPVLRVGEVCRELDLPKSSVSRLLKELGDFGMVEREQGEFGYGVGRRALTMADVYLSRHSLLDQIDVAIDTLTAEFGFVGYAGVQSGADIIILRVKHGPYPLRLVQEVGKRIPAFRTAIGRALLAREDDAEMIALVRNGADEALAPGEIAARLGEVRRTGVSEISNRVVPGIAAVGAAVCDPMRGEALGFALSYPESATDEAMRARMARRVREEAQAIGIRCGDTYWTGFGADAESSAPAEAAFGGAPGGGVIGADKEGE